MIIKKTNYQRKIKLLEQASTSKGNTTKIKRIIAGLRLEKDMAYYLDIAFEKSDNILVINDLKIECNGKTAQIDHLVLTCYSAYFIESKSVSGSLQVNEYDEWTRWYGKIPTNVDSPLLQSKRHEKILFNLLQDHVPSFMGRVLGFQKRLGSYTAHHYIAVSTKCNITGKGRDKHKDHLLKADQITEAISSFHNEHAKGYLASVRDSSNDDRFKTMTKNELLSLGEFLMKSDISDDDPFSAFNISQPATPINEPEPYQTQEPREEYTEKMQTSICPECEKEMDILWGRKHKNYYWHCAACGKNVSTTTYCPGCKRKLKIRKEKNKHFVYCEPCGTEALLHESH